MKVKSDEISGDIESKGDGESSLEVKRSEQLQMGSLVDSNTKVKGSLSNAAQAIVEFHAGNGGNIATRTSIRPAAGKPF